MFLMIESHYVTLIDLGVTMYTRLSLGSTCPDGKHHHTQLRSQKQKLHKASFSPCSIPFCLLSTSVPKAALDPENRHGQVISLITN